MDTSFHSRGFELQGTFTEAAPPRATVLILNGSGPLDRDSNVRGQRLGVAPTIANVLAAADIGSFRFDKCGTGASQGDYISVTFDDETDDAFAALQHARTLGPPPYIVCGHSVGATIAMRLAARSQGPDGAVLLSGAAQRGEAVMIWQSQRIADTLPWWLGPFHRMFLKRQEKARRAILAAPPGTTKLKGKPSNVAWMQEFMAFDPMDVLPQISVPVLAITGAKDIQVDAADLDLIGKTVAGPFEQQSPPDLTHLLRDDPRPPGILTYKKQFEMPVSPTVTNAIVEWVERRA